MVADCGLETESESQLELAQEPEPVSAPADDVYATGPLHFTEACSQDDEEPSYSPERVFEERERRERPPRRYDKA